MLAPLNLEFMGVEYGFPSTLSFERDSTFAITDIEVGQAMSARPRGRQRRARRWSNRRCPMFSALFGIVRGAGRFISTTRISATATREGARYAIVNGANTIGLPDRTADRIPRLVTRC